MNQHELFIIWCQGQTALGWYVDQMVYRSYSDTWQLKEYNHDLKHREHVVQGAWIAYKELTAHIEFKNAVIARQRKTIEQLQGRKTREDAQHDFDDLG